jgi:SnoaL-like domain
MDDVTAITRNVAAFACRDQGRWDELRALFHPDAGIHVTWYSGPITGFIERSAEMAAAVLTKHVIGASRVTVSGARALGDTDVVILNRMKLGSVEVDATSHARFFDRFERRRRALANEGRRRSCGATRGPGSRHGDRGARALPPQLFREIGRGQRDVE